MVGPHYTQVAKWLVWASVNMSFSETLLSSTFSEHVHLRCSGKHGRPIRDEMIPGRENDITRCRRHSVMVFLMDLFIGTEEPLKGRKLVTRVYFMNVCKQFHSWDHVGLHFYHFTWGYLFILQANLVIPFQCKTSRHRTIGKTSYDTMIWPWLILLIFGYWFYWLQYILLTMFAL